MAKRMTWWSIFAHLPTLWEVVCGGFSSGVCQRLLLPDVGSDVGSSSLDEYVIFIQQQQLNPAIKANCYPLRQKVACVFSLFAKQLSWLPLQLLFKIHNLHLHKDCFCHSLCMLCPAPDIDFWGHWCWTRDEGVSAFASTREFTDKSAVHCRGGMMCNRRNLLSEFQMRSTLKRLHSERKLMAVTLTVQHCHCLIHQPYGSSLPLTVGFHYYGTLLVSFLSFTPYVSVFPFGAPSQHCSGHCRICAQCSLKLKVTHHRSVSSVACNVVHTLNHFKAVTT